MISIYSNFLDVDITQLTELMQSDDLCIKNEEFVSIVLLKQINALLHRWHICGIRASKIINLTHQNQKNGLHYSL